MLNPYLYSLEGVDECNEFISLVNSESEINDFSYPYEYELPRLFFTNDPTSYGYDSETVYKRNKNNRVDINTLLIYADLCTLKNKPFIFLIWKFFYSS